MQERGGAEASAQAPKGRGPGLSSPGGFFTREAQRQKARRRGGWGLQTGSRRFGRNRTKAGVRSPPRGRTRPARLEGAGRGGGSRGQRRANPSGPRSAAELLSRAGLESFDPLVPLLPLLFIVRSSGFGFFFLMFERCRGGGEKSPQWQGGNPSAQEGGVLGGPPGVPGSGEELGSHPYLPLTPTFPRTPKPQPGPRRPLF